MKREVQPRLDELARRCKEAGMAVTPQRMAIFTELVAAEDHPSPEMLHERLVTTMPTMSLATIYKTLDALEELGLVDEVAPLGGTKRYDANHRPHHHLVCTQCHRVMDFYDHKLDTLAAPKGQLHGFVPESVTVQIKGLCASCSRRS